MPVSKRFYIITLWLFLSLSVEANDTLHYQRSLKHLVQLEQDSALLQIKAISDPSLKYYMHHYQCFWSVMVLKNQESDYRDFFDTYITEVNENDFGLLSQMYLQSVVYELQQENHFSAFRRFITAHSYWKQNVEYNPDDIQNIKLEGLFNVLIGNLSHTQLSVAGFFGFSGSAEEGFNLLDEYVELVRYKPGLFEEAVLLKIYAQLKLANDKQGLSKILESYRTSDSPFLKALLTQSAFKVRDDKEVREILNADSDYWMLHYLRIKYNLLSFYSEGVALAEQYLSSAIPDYKADVLKYVAWYFASQGKSALYQRYMEELLALNDYPTNEDRQALYEAENYACPNKYLIQARMLFDLGKYTESILALSQSRQSNVDELECLYRYARNFHELGRVNEAKGYYLGVVKLAMNDKRYFGPYAAIYLAEFSLGNNNPEQVIYYYELATKLNNGEYKNAISRKVEMALNKL